MATHLSPVDLVRIPAWIERCRSEYVADLVASGQTLESAHLRAGASLERAFPSQAPANGHAVFDIIDENEDVVGYVWLGPDTSRDDGAWWVWDIHVDAAKRGEGHGRAAMLLGEKFAHSQGAHTIGLSVFGFNGAARGLYESLGYEPTAISMRKNL